MAGKPQNASRGSYLQNCTVTKYLLRRLVRMIGNFSSNVLIMHDWLTAGAQLLFWRANLD
jgi:hypothetical protein